MIELCDWYAPPVYFKKGVLFMPKAQIVVTSEVESLIQTALVNEIVKRRPAFLEGSIE